MSDRIFGLIGLAIAGFYLWATSIIPDSFMVDAVGPRAFPYIVGTILAICALYFLLRPDAEPDWPVLANLIEIIFATAVMFLYAWALSRVGFIIATVLATTYLSWRLGTRPLGALVTGIGTAVGIYVVFYMILGLSLAKGPLGF
jgi:putative tricarboxylic transport membrane protein